MEVGQIVKLYIPHFKNKERYFLIYDKDDADYFLFNITSRDKRESANPIPQYKLITKLDTISLVNLNTKILTDYKLFFELIGKLPQQNKDGEPLPQLSKKELGEIKRDVDDCFSNEKYRGNRYKIRVE